MPEKSIGKNVQYDFRTDFTDSYWLACRFLALRCGSAHPGALWEMYWLESQGLIP
jgi:hypothetical protein